MLVKLHRPYFVSGEMRFPGGEPVEVPDDLGAVEIAKGNAVPASAPAAEPVEVPDDLGAVEIAKGNAVPASAPAAESEPAPVVETKARKGKGGKRGG